MEFDGFNGGTGKSFKDDKDEPFGKAGRRSSFKKAKNRFIKFLILLAVVLILGGVFIFNSAPVQRGIKTIFSEYGGGLDRTVNVYTYNRELIASYTGKVDI